MQDTSRTYVQEKHVHGGHVHDTCMQHTVARPPDERNRQFLSTCDFLDFFISTSLNMKKYLKNIFLES